MSAVATVEKILAESLTIEQAILAIQTQNRAILGALTIVSLTVDGNVYQMIANVDGGTDTLVGGKSRGNGFKETDAHKMVRALAAEKGARWVILIPDAPEVDAETGLMRVKRPEGAINRAYADLAGAGFLRANPKKGKIVTAESQATPKAVKNGLGKCPKKEDLLTASPATVKAYNDHQRVKGELLCIVTKWY